MKASVHLNDGNSDGKILSSYPLSAHKIHTNSSSCIVYVFDLYMQGKFLSPTLAMSKLPKKTCICRGFSSPLRNDTCPLSIRVAVREGFLKIFP